MIDVAASPLIAAPPRLQRAAGRGRVAVQATGARTGLRDLFQEGCAQIRLPRDAAARGLEAVLINTAGGLTGGDRLSWRAEAAQGAALTISTPACEKVYRARDDAAETLVTLAAGPGAHLAWLPQETILFDGAALRRRLDIDLAADAEVLVVEAVVLGREAMGERIRAGALHDRWRVRRDGRLVFADDLRLDGPVSEISGLAATLAGGRAFASLLLVAPDAQDRLRPLREALGDLEGAGGGASAFDGKLFCRIVAREGRTLRSALVRALGVLRQGQPIPRVWRT